MGTRAPAAAAALDDFFARHYRRRPVDATFIGVHEYDDRLPDYSERGAGDALAETVSLGRRLRDLPREPLDEAEALDLTLAEGALEIQRWEYESAHFHRGNPCVYTGEAVFGVMSLFLRPFGPASRRVEAARARLAAIPTLLAQGRATVRRAPPAWTARAARECAGAGAFLKDGIDLLIQDPGVRAAADAAAAAFGEFQEYLDKELLVRPAGAYACDGEALERLLRRGHFLDTDAAGVLALARERLEVCEAALDAIAAESGAPGWRDVLAQLADRHPPVERYYARYPELWEAARRAAEAPGLLTWPDYPIRYVPIPAWVRAAAPHLYFLAYRSPAPYDRAAEADYLVPPIDPGMPAAEQARLLRATNDSVIKLNHVIHHGGIGHHVQNWHAFRAASRIGQVAAVDCASRIALFCGGTMAEGWACYATDLMDEIGFLSPLEHCAHVHARLRMAARALVDVNLHHGAMSLEEAAAFYRDRVGMAPEAALAEAVKNSMFPGTALMYLVGTDLIHRLRRELSARQPGFDLRRFHDRFLSYGSVPVSLIGAAMRKEAAYARSGEAGRRHDQGEGDG